MRLTALMVTTALMGLSATAHADNPRDVVQEGRQLFNAVGCWACHGYDGPGTLSGPQLAGTALLLPSFERLLRHPVKLMPAYSEQLLSSAQVAKILVYLQSLPAGPAAKDIKLLNP